MIDILLATYNGADYLREQIESILEQECHEWRILARDDGSTDNTLEILQEYANRHPEKIEIIKGANNIGAIKSFSELMAISTSPYIAFCDQDDVWKREKLSIMLEAAKQIEAENGVDFPVLVHSDLEVVTATLDIIYPSFWHYQGINQLRNSLENLLVENTVTGCATLFNRALLTCAFPVHEKAYMHDYWLALTAAATGKIVSLSEPQIKYRQHGKNTLGAKKKSSIFSALRRATSLATWQVSYRQSCDQAEALYNRLQGKVPEQRLIPLKKFSHLYEQGWLNRRLILLKYDILPALKLRKFSLLARI